MALAMLTALGVAYDGSEGYGYPNAGFGQQNEFAPGPDEMGTQYPAGQPDGMGPSDSMGGPASMGSQGHNHDQSADSYDNHHGSGGPQDNYHHGSDGHHGNYYDWLSPGYTYTYYSGYPEYYPYSYYPYTYTYPTYYYTNPTYYYTTPAYYSTYYYPYNWYDPWWSANAYGVGGVSYYSSSWSGSYHHGGFYWDLQFEELRKEPGKKE